MRIAIFVALLAIAGLFIVHQIWAMVRDARRGPAGSAEDAAARADASDPQGGPAIGIAFTEWGSVIVQAATDALVLIVLPQRDPRAIDLVATTPELGRHVMHAIFLNDPAIGGYLWATTLRDRLGLDPERMFATAPGHPIDRLPAPGDGEPRTGKPLPDDVEVGVIDIERLAPNAIRISAVEDDEQIVIGTQLDESLLERALDETGTVLRAVGSIAGAIQSLDVIAALSRGGLTVLAGVPPAIDDALIQFFQVVGVTVQVIHGGAPPPAWAPIAGKLVEAARADDADALRAQLAEHGTDAVPHALAVLAITNELDAADALAGAAIARTPDSAELRMHVATIAALRGDQDAAERELRAAIVADPAHGPSLVNLAAELMRRGDDATHAEAVTLADRALAQLPDDPLAHRSVILTRLHADDVPGARTKLAELAPRLGDAERLRLQATIDAYADGARPPSIATFPALANLARVRANELLEAQRFDEAVPLFERAYELDRTSLELAADLGYALSQAGRDREALAHYDRAIEAIQGGALLRINRGNVRRRLGDLDGAIADYRFLLERAPTLTDARLALYGALLEAKRSDEAQAELRTLEQASLPAELLAALREAGATNAPRANMSP
ncbi:MAG TPA: tetratricopeptide repeat protein [Kofleriaceae bacterium]|nr:tetratricopeptide repeat protein [Kofleriaceae bacterium]